jgi:hypothetical protein
MDCSGKFNRDETGKDAADIDPDPVRTRCRPILRRGTGAVPDNRQ